MNPQRIKQILVPALAVAALVVVAAIFFVVADRPDVSTTGLSDAMPPATGDQWVGTPDGIRTCDVLEGKGESVGEGRKVTMHYTGWLAANGQKFDGSRDKGVPLEISLDEVILGWQKGIPGMKVGGIRRIYIPAKLGYGEKGSPPAIPPNADLIFEVKLVKFK